MIFLEGLESIIESIYLNEELCNKLSSCNIFVNPGNPKYLIGKTVIINKLDYPNEKIDILDKNNCHIISRVFIDNPLVEIRPYILRINFNVMWNGRVVDTNKDLIENDLCDFDIENSVLYFPKIKDLSNTIDEFGNLTAIGWVLQQVGINIKQNTEFINLDVIKTSKVKIE